MSGRTHGGGGVDTRDPFVSCQLLSVGYTYCLMSSGAEASGIIPPGGGGGREVCGGGGGGQRASTAGIRPVVRLLNVTLFLSGPQKSRGVEGCGKKEDVEILGDSTAHAEQRRGGGGSGDGPEAAKRRKG